jgi:hypothetical protein
VTTVEMPDTTPTLTQRGYRSLLQIVLNATSGYPAQAPAVNTDHGGHDSND